ncbi:hypothetical protein D3C78_1733300 [compost metagenome]
MQQQQIYWITCYKSAPTASKLLCSTCCTALATGLAETICSVLVAAEMVELTGLSRLISSGWKKSMSKQSAGKAL